MGREALIVSSLILSVDSDGNIIVADEGNKLIKIFSPDGKFLMKIGGQGGFTLPIHCVQCDRYLIVSGYREHCIKVYDRNGKFQYKFGKQGRGDGEFNNPCCLSVNKSGHLMVCDYGNDRIQVFKLNGRFVGKFGTKGSNLGEFKSPRSVAVLSNGRIDPLQDPVTWYGIYYTGTQMTQERHAALVRVPLFWESHCVICVPV